MKKTRPKIFIIGLSLFIFSLSTSIQSASLYRCVNSKGSIMLTDNIPTNPDYKCTFAASYRESIPQERAQYQRKPQGIKTQQEYQREPQRKADGEQEYDKKMKIKVDLEKNWLEDRKKKFGTSDKFGREATEILDERGKELEKNPEQYFYNKEQRETAAAAAKRSKSRPQSESGLVIDPKTGRVIQGIPIQ